MCRSSRCQADVHIDARLTLYMVQPLHLQFSPEAILPRFGLQRSRNWQNRSVLAAECGFGYESDPCMGNALLSNPGNILTFATCCLESDAPSRCFWRHMISGHVRSASQRTVPSVRTGGWGRAKNAAIPTRKESTPAVMVRGRCRGVPRCVPTH